MRVVFTIEVKMLTEVKDLPSVQTMLKTAQQILGQPEVRKQKLVRDGKSLGAWYESLLKCYDSF